MTHILFLLVSKGDRREIEDFFSEPITIEDVKKVNENIMAMPIYDFTTAWNDSDDDTREQKWEEIINKSDLDNYWIGSANIKKP